jgi:predicted nucleotidyltransferase
MDDRIRDLLAELRRRLAGLYGPRLKGVFLFGSLARNEADEESDVDVLIVLDRADNYGREIARTSALVSALSLQCGRSISCVYASQEQWEKEDTMFFLNVREEAIPA